MNITSGILNGRRTPRGVGVTRTVSCSMQAIWNASMNGLGGLTLPVPIPPRMALRRRHMMCIKYFSDGDPAGVFYLIERQSSTQVALARGYPLLGVAGPESRRQRRFKQIHLPITGHVLIFTGTGVLVESGSSLEYG